VLELFVRELRETVKNRKIIAHEVSAMNLIVFIQRCEHARVGGLAAAPVQHGRSRGNVRGIELEGANMAIEACLVLNRGLNVTDKFSLATCHESFAQSF
jgi:hypothetical protein